MRTQFRLPFDIIHSTSVPPITLENGEIVEWIKNDIAHDKFPGSSRPGLTAARNLMAPLHPAKRCDLSVYGWVVQRIPCRNPYDLPHMGSASVKHCVVCISNQHMTILDWKNSVGTSVKQHTSCSAVIVQGKRSLGKNQKI